jgi:hypothetical protein
MPPEDAIQTLDALNQFYKVNEPEIEILGIDDSIDIPFEDYLELIDEVNDEI